MSFGNATEEVLGVADTNLFCFPWGYATEVSMVKTRGSGMKLCQGEHVRRVTLAARLAGHWDNFPVGKWWNSYWEGN